MKLKYKYWGAPRYRYVIKARSYRGVDFGYLKNGEKVLLFSKPVLAKISIKNLMQDTDIKNFNRLLAVTPSY